MASIDQAIAAPDESVDHGVAWHYGDPLGEQRALVERGGVVDLSHLGVVSVSGSDRLSWLNDLTSQLVANLVPGSSSMALILDPKGHVEHELRLVDDGVVTWLISERSQVDGLVAYLDSMRFMRDVAVQDTSNDWAALWLAVPEDGSAAVADAAIEVLAGLDPVIIWNPPAEFLGTGETDAGEDRGGTAAKYVPERPGSLTGVLALIPRVDLQSFLAERDDLAGTWAFEALRVAAGVPRSALEGDHRALPHELGLIGPAVHLAKGCYRGQETVARVHNMGKPPRRLALLHLDGSAGDLPVTGADVLWNGRAIGRVGSVAQHYELGPIALAVLKRSVPVEDVLEVVLGDEEDSPTVAATQQVIVVA